MKYQNFKSKRQQLSFPSDLPLCPEGKSEQGLLSSCYSVVLTQLCFNCLIKAHWPSVPMSLCNGT